MFGFIQLVIILLIALIVFHSLVEWLLNLQAPVLTQHAVVVAKRSDIYHHHHDDFFSSETVYIVTFLLENGEKHSFRVSRRVYQDLNEGIVGKLTYKGTRFKSFEIE